MNLSDRIDRWLSAVPGAVSGQGGHSQTFSVACALVNGWALDRNSALSYLASYNTKCQPPWSDRELEHKVAEAEKVTHDKPRGHLIGTASNATITSTRTNRVRSEYIPQEAPPKPSPIYKPDEKTVVPAPLPDAARQFLLAAFKPGESIGIAQALLNKEQRCIPQGSGQTFTREEWLAKLDAAQGDPNSLWATQGIPCGAFIRINPLKPGGAKDEDVTAFRHALLEFDNCSIEAQWSLLTQSGIPCTAILHSGNKSLHAWVRVDAKDRTEYAARVKKLYDHFNDYGIDPKNKNPSRFSRLPGMLRGDKRQELLSLKCGAESFDKWLIDREADGIGQHITIADLLAFESESDPNNVLGRRWLCRGGSALWIGQSGTGKSSLAMQAAVYWALGLPFFGIKPGKPLRSLFIQAENDIGDMAEMFRGVVGSLPSDLFNGDIAEVRRLLRENLIIIRDQIHTGQRFAEAATRLIAKHSPDLAWVDPLLSYIGDDISSQKVCSEFLRNWLNPISEATGVIWMMLHHTGKPSNDPKSRKGWTSTDHAYLGTGSSELVNWARAVVVLKKYDEETYQLMFAKRGRRAGAKDISGQYASDIYLRHSDTGICWGQAEAPTEDEKESKPGRSAIEFDLVSFVRDLRSQAAYMSASAIQSLVCKKAPMSRRTFYAKTWPKLQNMLTYDDKTETYSA